MAYTTINKSTANFKTKVFTGNNSSLNVTGVGFQPGFVWFKPSTNTDSHSLYDEVRTATKRLKSDDNSEETTQSNGLTAFGADGFTVGAHVGTQTVSSWNWKAGGSTSSNTSGTLTSTVSVNTTAGFSICKYTGATGAQTFGHGLGAVPKFIMIKNLDSSGGSAEHWRVYHHSIGHSKYLRLNDYSSEISDSGPFSGTTPTSTLVYVGGDDGTTKNGESHIAYCFSEVPGYSKFGEFRGVGSAFPSSPFIYLGFKPKFFMWKNIDDGGSDDNWNIVNSEAQGFNGKDAGYLMANSGAYNFSGNTINLLSNGVKIDVASAYHNQNNCTYVYAAFGQTLVGTNNIPVAAR